MKYFVYLISDYTHKNIHCGYTSDLIKLLELYNILNITSLNYHAENYLNRIVYMEEVKKEGTAIDRLLYFTHLPLIEKIAEIQAVNPQWLDLSLDPNFNI